VVPLEYFNMQGRARQPVRKQLIIVECTLAVYFALLSVFRGALSLNSLMLAVKGGYHGGYVLNRRFDFR